MKSGMKNSFEILATGRFEDRPGANHLAVCGRIEFILYRDTVPTSDLAAQGIWVFGEDKIRLFTIDDGVDFRVKQVTRGKSEFDVFQLALVNHVYGTMVVRHSAES
jgi:hypothetical protein